MLSVFGFAVFRGSTFAFFRVFFVLLMSGFRSLTYYSAIVSLDICVNFRQPRMQEVVSFIGENAVLFLQAPYPSFSCRLFYFGDLLSWNKLRDNTATTHRRNCFW